MDPDSRPSHPSIAQRTAVPLLVLAGSAAVIRSLVQVPATRGFQVLPNWAALVAVAAAGASVAASRRIHRSRVVKIALGGSSIFLLVIAADGIAFDVVGVIMSVVAALTGQAMAVGLEVDPAGIVVRVLAGIAGVMVGSSAIAYRRYLRGGCLRCGQVSEGSSGWTSNTAAYAAFTLAVGYAAEKVYWGLGGTVGLASKDAFGDNVRLWTPGLGDTAVLALVGAGIALALARPRGTRLPRWIPIAGAGLGSMMLIPVGIIGTVSTLVNLSEPSSPQNEVGLEPWVFLIEYPWFFAWGVTLGLAALAFYYRTRGQCALCGRGADHPSSRRGRAPSHLALEVGQ